jgi:hypothetical protein
MKLLRLFFTTITLISCVGCVGIFRHQIDRDELVLQTAQNQFRCEASVNDIERILRGKLETMDSPHPDMTHLYRLEFADLRLIFKDGKLQSSQVFVISDGLKMYRVEKRINHCSS